MATVYPPHATQPGTPPAGQPLGIAREIETLQWLRTALPDGYTVFHSIHLAWVVRDRLLKREADFLVVNRAGQVLMVEQKAGRLEETAAGLAKSYAGGAAKAIVTQCHEITDALRDRFRAAYGAAAKLSVDFVLYCPHHAVREPTAAGIAPRQIVDARSWRSLPQVIQRLLPQREPDPEQFERVRRMLAQVLQLDADRQALAAAGERVLVQLTDGLTDFLGRLEMAPYRLRVEGTAGCGKTRMLDWFARRAQGAGQRCLVTCFNRPLADELRASLPETAEVDTLHGLALRLLQAAGHDPGAARNAQTPDFWAGVVAAATDLALEGVPEAFLADTLLVDEGQDIDQDGYDLLRLLLRPDAGIVWLADEDQRLHRTRPFAEPGFVTYRCRDNHRSPRLIAAFIKALLPFEFEPRNPFLGNVVQVTESGAATVAGCVAERVEHLVDLGYAPEQIVVLSGRGRHGSALMGVERFGRHTTRRSLGYDATGKAVHTDGLVQVETVRRFKGQQAPAVIACELDGDPAADPLLQRLLYCAATRATAHLEFVVPKSGILAAPLRRAAQQASAA